MIPLRNKTNRLIPGLLLLAGLLALCPLDAEAQQRARSQPDPRMREAMEMNRMAAAARGMEQRGDWEAALNLYRKLVETAPQRGDFFDGLRRSLVALERYDEAIRVMRERLEQRPAWMNPVSLYADLGAVYLQAGREAEADQAFEQALASAPGPAPYHAVATALLRLRRVDEALEVYRRGRRQLGDSTRFAVHLAGIHRARMAWDEAAREALTALRQSPGRRSFTERTLAGFPDDSTANAAVESALRAELERADRAEPPWAGYEGFLVTLLSNHHRKNGDWSAALDVLTRHETGRTGHELVAFAADAAREGHREVAREALERAAGVMDQAAGLATVNLARAQFARRQGQFRRADSLLVAMIESAPGPAMEARARFERGRLALEDLHDPALAARQFRALLAMPRGVESPAAPGTVETLLATALAKRDSLDAAQEVLAGIPHHRVRSERGIPVASPYADAEQADARWLGARIALWQGTLDSLRARLESVVAPPLGADAENDALVWLKLLTTTGDSAGLVALGRADHARFMGDTQRAIAIFDSLAAGDSTGVALEAAWQAAWLRLTGVEPPDTSAVREFARARPDHPRAEEALFRLGRWLERRGRPEAAARIYTDLLTAHPDGLFARQTRLRLDELRTPGAPMNGGGEETSR